MFMNRNFIRQNITSISIIIYIILYALIIAYKPGFIYNADGTLRQFGVGLKKRTVIPIWLLAIVLAIITYFSVLYYIASPKINF
jgi:hypothetical protein